MIRLEMKNCNTILAEKQQKYQLYRLEKIDRYEFFTGEEILPPGQRRVIKQATFAYSLFFIIIIFFFYLDFLSRTFTNHETAEERGGNFFNSSLPLQPASQTFRH